MPIEIIIIPLDQITADLADSPRGALPPLRPGPPAGGGTHVVALPSPQGTTPYRLVSPQEALTIAAQLVAEGATIALEALAFLAQLDLSGGLGACWLWLGVRNDRGYGSLQFRRRVEGAHRVAWMLFQGEIPPDLHVCHHCDCPACCNPAHLFLGTRRDNMRDMLRKERGVWSTHPERMPRGGGHWTRLHPEQLARGDKHWTHLYPDRVARGERNGSRLYPERLRRGDQHPARLHPGQRRGERNGRAKLTAGDVRIIRIEYAAGGVSQGMLARHFGVDQTQVSAIVRGTSWAGVVL